MEDGKRRQNTPRRDASKRTLYWILRTLAGLGVLLLIWVAAVLWVRLDEAAVPGTSAFPDLPTELIVGEPELQCASGGCWRELEVQAGTAARARQLATDLGLETEQCGAWNPLIWRRTCIGAHVAGTAVRIYAQYDYAGID
ncbi:hypothetical protein [Glutamicibacter sp. V16R2B1]|uniref:hypothetical protein n=1 Tax=Glutamicibacter sp. V16R2B1 TaxID=2036207 RepID=UPI0010FD9E53|nr:hypothetical protein [Glutamicibacter sp. V16R2B1]TLK56349.1 hypothetical protein FDN03_02575 [Glutamicibacter sp. V16R2B1]